MSYEALPAKPPMPYSGGKQKIARKIVDLLPPHDSYCEPFAGGLSVLLAKPVAPIETVNDLNGDLVAFWRVLRDQPDDLARACALTPHSRAEYRAGLDVDVDLEKARRVWVQLTQGRGSRLNHSSGWRFVHGGNRMSLAAYLDGYLARIAPTAQRLKHVSLECRDALEIIDAYGIDGALLYVDPPYLATTRCEVNQYQHEFASVSQHEALIRALRNTDSMVCLSGYDSDLYRDVLGDWHKAEIQTVNMRGAARVEHLWMNYEPHASTFDFSGNL